MIEFRDLILNNKQFLEICNGEQNCNSFLFESSDKIFLNNFSYCFAQFLLCSSNKKPCGSCLNCQKVSLLAHADLKIYPLNKKNILVDDIKDLIINANLKPVESDYKIFIFNDFSTANIQSQNKLLKILEEPPKNTYIILNVSNINKILQTVISRCKKIRLQTLSDDEIKKFVNFKDISNDKIEHIIDLSQGSLEKANNYSLNNEFLTTFDSCLKTLSEMKDSKVLIKFSSLFSKNKSIFEMSLEIFENLYRDLLLLKLGKENLIVNKNLLYDLKSISKEYTCDAIDLIIKKIYLIKKQLEFNCNYLYLIDSFLLYILEVKFLCKK